MHKFGDVVFVPKDLSYAQDPKGRWHVPMHDERAEGLTFVAYSSSQDSQARLGAPCDVVQPATAKGLDLTTFVYPGLLTPLRSEDLDLRGQLARDEALALSALAEAALGIKTGARGAKGYENSRRGTIVRFRKRLSDTFSDTQSGVVIEYGVVLTPHHLSTDSSTYQLVVPLLEDFEPLDPDELEIKKHAATRPWPGWSSQDTDSVLALVPSTAHVLHRDLNYLNAVIDEKSLSAIEETLLRRIGNRDGSP